jgi:lysophospholipase L1-like esterase
MIRAHLIVLSAAALISATNAPALGQTRTVASVADACVAANRNLFLGARLPRTRARLKAGGPLRVVTVGSSSTVGFGVLSSAATYPEVMRRELAALRRGTEIEVINSGRLFDTIPGSTARFQRDVLAYRPDLVIWQLGTNDATWARAVDELKDQVIQGVRALKANGADVVLMDLQYAPLVLASPRHATMQALIADAAHQEQVGLFPRFALMRRAIEAGLPRGALVSWDGLHNSADGYDCIGRTLARAIDVGAR